MCIIFFVYRCSFSLSNIKAHDSEEKLAGSTGKFFAHSIAPILYSDVVFDIKIVEPSLRISVFSVFIIR